MTLTCLSSRDLLRLGLENRSFRPTVTARLRSGFLARRAPAFKGAPRGVLGGAPAAPPCAHRADVYDGRVDGRVRPCACVLATIVVVAPAIARASDHIEVVVSER